jgi:hypothetical protein
MTSSPNAPKRDTICPCGKAFTKAGFKQHQCDQKPPTFICSFCKKELTSETRLLKHLCEQKLRFLSRDDMTVRRGFVAFERYFKRSMGKTVTEEAFRKSQVYGAFVRFGKHLLDINPIGGFLLYVDYLTDVEVKIDDWTKDFHYRNYAKEYSRTETATAAIERSFKIMESWGTDTGENWLLFFHKIATPRAVLWISSGRISPWLLFSASTSYALFDRFTPEQSAMVEAAIDTEFWKLKINKHKEEFETLTKTLAEYGI